jgi:hypothetical protein
MNFVWFTTQQLRIRFANASPIEDHADHSGRPTWFGPDRLDVLYMISQTTKPSELPTLLSGAERSSEMFSVGCWHQSRNVFNKVLGFKCGLLGVLETTGHIPFLICVASDNISSMDVDQSNSIRPSQDALQGRLLHTTLIIWADLMQWIGFERSHGLDWMVCVRFLPRMLFADLLICLQDVAVGTERRRLG